MTQRIRMTVAYDGTSFSGWQVQSRDRTVQGVVEEALAVMEKQPVRITAAGRTDSGVHARGQVVHFDTSIASIEAAKFAPALNSLLPPDVRISESSAAGPDFHARFGAVARTYRYFLFRGSGESPFVRPFCYARKNLPSAAVLNRTVAPLVGEHDFTPFTAAGDPSPTKVRTIYQAAFLEKGGMLEFRITGNAFLWRMVRSIVGTVLEIAEEEAPDEKMRSILRSGRRDMAGTTAPARGLFFWKVHYNTENLYG
jgi:tRNA pseudouridine38-40 synthase